ncbi:MAG: tetratricopeptide repeat protein, partial [Acidobacteriota bacterium]|nr:tetratricopeptide repeat protein [Acidobacteriota bacterium]
MHNRNAQRAALMALFVFAFAAAAFAQSGATRPRRVSPEASTVQNPTTNPTPTPAPRTTAQTATPPRSAASTSANSSGDTTRAYALLQQKQYDAALKEAKQIAAAAPQNEEAWKIAGFAEFNLKQYKEAAIDLQRALELQRAAGSEDANTVDALAQAYIRTEEFEKALPLLVTATTRAGTAQPDAALLYYRGLAEYRTGKQADAERSFNVAVKADPKNAASHFYLGRIAYERNGTDAAIQA